MPSSASLCHPSSTIFPYTTRFRSLEMYVEVIDLLVAESGATVLLTGAEDERELVKRIVSKLRKDSRDAIHTFVGTLPFPALCALIEDRKSTRLNSSH